MVVLDNILSTMRKNNISQKQLCEHLGINKQAFTNWKNGTHSSYQKYLPQIAEFLGVSIDYLLGNTENKTTLDEQLDGIDFALFGEVKDMTDKQKQDVLNFAKFIKSNNEKSDD